MRYIGIDYGTKRIGLALSDESGSMAFPREVIEGGEGGVGYIVGLIEREGVSHIVLGESKDLSGMPNPVAAAIEMFKKVLEREANVPVSYEPEFMTSAQAARPAAGEARAVASPSPRAKEGPLDAKAATLILQGYLDRMQSTNR